MVSIAVKTFGVCDFSRLAVTDWRLRHWRLWFLALMTATHLFQVLSGAFLLGFTCATAAPVNLWPSLCLELVDAVKAGRLEEAKEKQTQLNAAIYAVSQYGQYLHFYPHETTVIIKNKQKVSSIRTPMLTHDRPAMPFGNRKKNIFEDLFSIAKI